MVTENDSRGNPHGPEPFERWEREFPERDRDAWNPLGNERCPRCRSRSLTPWSPAACECGWFGEGAVVHVVVSGDRCHYGTILAQLDGDRWLVNVGNVFRSDGYYEYEVAAGDFDPVELGSPVSLVAGDDGLCEFCREPANVVPLHEGRAFSCEHVYAIATSPCCAPIRRLLRERGIDTETFLTATTGGPVGADETAPF